MKIIRIDCCMDCPLSKEEPIGAGMFIPKCLQLKRSIPVTTFQKRKIWSKCKLEDKK